MCGRYSILHQTPDYLADRFHLAEEPKEVQANYNVAPGQIMPVITEDEKGRHVELMKWGLVPSWSKDPKIGYKLINARSETAFIKPMWRKVVKSRRCLVPANGFYEWKRLDKGPKQPFYIHPKKQDLFTFAGVWDIWHDAEGNKWSTYSIMTTEPNGEMSAVHNRMPVILHEEDEALWLDHKQSEQNEIETLLRPYEDNGLEMFEVSTDVNSVRNNDNYLITPINSK